MQNGVHSHFAGEGTDKIKMVLAGAFINGVSGNRPSVVNDLGKVLSGECMICKAPQSIMEGRVGRSKRAARTPWYFIDQIATEG